MTIEELGLLKILERLEADGGALGPSVRFALSERGLIEGDPPELTQKGEQVLEELRLRPLRRTGEFPKLDLRPVRVRIT